MHYRGLLVLLLCVLPFALKAQDLVVTQEGDSLHCRITNVWGEQLSLNRLVNGKLVPLQLAMTQVKSYRFNYFKPTGAEQAVLSQEPEQPKPPRWSIGLSGGYVYRLASYPDGIEESARMHVRRLKHGHHIDADLTMFFGKRRTGGMGLSVSRSVSNASSSGVVLDDGYGRKVRLSRVEERVTITNVGLFSCSRMMNDKHTFLTRYGVGISTFVDEIDGSMYLHTNNGSVLELFCELGYSYRVRKHMSVGGKLSLMRGVVRELWATTNREQNSNTRYTYLELPKEQWEGLGRLKLGFEMRFDF